MQGTITSFENHSGTIAGYDGKQYKFVTLDWKNKEQLPRINMEVDFNIEGKEARNISLLRSPNARSKNALAAWCFFLGCSGIHRFMVGKIGTGLLILFSVIFLNVIMGILPKGMANSGPLIILWMFGVLLWVIIDFIMIVSGNFTDKNGNKIS